jgi:hypothetical protein
MATNLKLQLGDDIRRLNIAQLTSYADFCVLVRSVFNIPALNGIQMAYQDEDKDWINIRSEMDMDEARAYSARLPSFKICVTTNNAVSQSPAPQEPSYPQLAPEDIGALFPVLYTVPTHVFTLMSARPGSHRAHLHRTTFFLHFPSPN